MKPRFFSNFLFGIFSAFINMVEYDARDGDRKRIFLNHFRF